MQRIFDKWLLPVLAVIIGGVILWGLIFAPGRPKEESNVRPEATAPK